LLNEDGGLGTIAMACWSPGPCRNSAPCLSAFYPYYRACSSQSSVCCWWVYWQWSHL